jgi:AraC-like DNA-binding protein
VGLNPKSVLRRYRLFEAAERVRRDGPVDWAALAAELHYSDQPHLVRDFHATFGMSPERYARADAATR